MDNTIRRNEICVIGLPRCDFVFSSTRTCFIAYEFGESSLEMNLLRHVLEKRDIQPVEAGGSLAPGQSAFCAKICSKIILSQFCAVLINNKEIDGKSIPNANVNMEYGLMLGFNKYVIPFQRSSQKLPFNVAGLDTIKYDNMNFERLAGEAVDAAIIATQQEKDEPVELDQLLSVFLLSQRFLLTPTHTEGDRNLLELGRSLGFNLLNDFGGLTYTYFGNFTMLRSETIVWRTKLLAEILDGRRSTIDRKVVAGGITEDQAVLGKEIFQNMQIWLLANSEEERAG